MGPRGKMAIGALLVLIGIWWYIPGGPFNSAAVPFSTLTNLQGLSVLLQGGLGILLVLVGAFVVWIERDELRIQREMESQDLGTTVETAVEPAAAEPAEEYVCETCGKAFDSERGRKIHEGQKH